MHQLHSIHYWKTLLDVKDSSLPSGRNIVYGHKKQNKNPHVIVKPFRPKSKMINGYFDFFEKNTFLIYNDNFFNEKYFNFTQISINYTYFFNLRNVKYNKS